MPATHVTHKAIIDYWAGREPEGGLGVDWAEAHERCWRCGYKSSLERCHIIPESLGGPNEASNLVLLCGRCHREAPNIRDSRIMWIWLRATCMPFRDLYWTVRGIYEFERMFGRKPFPSASFNASDKERALTLLKEEIENAIVHFGEGRLNPATIASIFARIEERVTGRLPTPVLGSSDSRYFFEAIGLIKEPAK